MSLNIDPQSRLAGSATKPFSLSFLQLYSCICACGLVAGPTRKAIRDSYQLPVSPEFLKDNDRADCITYTIPCVNCFAVCQDAREVYYRNPAGPLKPETFDWGVSTEAPAPAATTAAPAQVEMTK